ncbi:hypothetical protein K0M31_019174 [Melipona bicolor]|uniref:Trichohyalin-plectin-homology domain-containing protein n=1 Tax=Melipona bicolor TaxID=60889 RepID=A0AA40KR34_9HYME|nr:hypothetical protein K0M31_019174 [Melipona bicolor]
MVQNQVVQRVRPAVYHQNKVKPMKSVKISKDIVETMTSKSSPHSVSKFPLLAEEETKNVIKEKNDVKPNERKEVQNEEKTIISAKEVIKRKRREDRLARKKKEEEERERFVKEAAERKAAEKEEIIKQAKRFILYRKPMCRRINQGLLISECYRELDAQLKFRETLKNIDKEEAIAYVNSIKEDVAKFEEEMKQQTENQLEKKKRYATELKKQIEETKNAAAAKEREEFEAEKQDQANMIKYLQDIKEYEAQQLQNKKQKLKQFFKDAIEEKKQFDLELKHEEEFEDRAYEIYRNAKLRIQKLHKAVKLKEKEEREQRTQIITERYSELLKSKVDMGEQLLKKAQQEEEEQYQEKQRIRKERENQMRKELQDYQLEVLATKAKQAQEERDLKTWETMQRFKRSECDGKYRDEERKKNRDKKIEYGNEIKRYINERIAERIEEKLSEEKAVDVTKIIEKENQKVLDYAEEVINESKDVRPLYPILKAAEECKREMGLIQPKKKGETIIEKPKRKRRMRRCTKFVPEDKICYL